MPMNLDKIWLFRIVHINNVEYLLHNGISTQQDPQSNSDYVNIGDTTLINQRMDYPINLEGYGNLGDYVPFYFGPLSPMLLNIKTGYRGIKQLPQSEIIYICCKLNKVINCGAQWCFTDGHAKNLFTGFYNDITDLDKVDWNIVYEKYWSNTEDDLDRIRRKQAEFLVKDIVPVNCIETIVVFNEEKRTFVQDLVDSLHLNISVKVNPKYKFYY
jgi:hypothetical protein